MYVNYISVKLLKIKKKNQSNDLSICNKYMSGTRLCTAEDKMVKMPLIPTGWFSTMVMN